MISSFITIITIPNSVEYIGNSAISNCSNLESIKCKAEKKSTGWDKEWTNVSEDKRIWGYTGN